MIRICLFVVAACLSLTSTASAQCGIIRRGPVFHSPVYHTPTVVREVITPVAVPILVPAFQYQYSPPCAIPAVPVPAGAAYPAVGAGVGYGQAGVGYGQPGVAQPGYGQQAGATVLPYGQNGFPQNGLGQPGVIDSQSKIRELAKALLEEMQKQSPQDDGPPAVPGAVQTSAPPPPAPPPVNGNPPGVNPGASPPGLPPGAGPATAPAMTPQQAAPIAMAALQRNCAACHTGPASKGDFVLFAQPDLFSQNVSWRSIVREITAGRMPPRYSQYRISPAEAAAVSAWLSGM